MVTAAGLDLLIGDPRWALHPVVVMGRLIQAMRLWLERWVGKRPWALRLSGVLISTILVLGSAASGWLVERLALTGSPIPEQLGRLLLVIALASALAARSLKKGVEAVLKALPPNQNNNEIALEPARQKLSWIVGRDVSQLDSTGILRATAETASENAVDGVFAPLFWMLVGAIIWQISPELPGPLALAWGFKASSTLDSMLGYRTGTLRWLGSAGARLDDALTWIPCRMVVLTLPLVSQPWQRFPALVKAAYRDGSMDLSPNAGLSEAIFAHCANVQMGGVNRYSDTWLTKPTLAASAPVADRQGIERLLKLGLHLELAWLAVIALVSGWVA